eukprot:3527473-Pyramimonas_sp.AAC.1
MPRVNSSFRPDQSADAACVYSRPIRGRHVDDCVVDEWRAHLGVCGGAGRGVHDAGVLLGEGVHQRGLARVHAPEDADVGPPHVRPFLDWAPLGSGRRLDDRLHLTRYYGGGEVAGGGGGEGTHVAPRRGTRTWRARPGFSGRYQRHDSYRT